MTIPKERTRAVQHTERFLFALCHRHCWEQVYPGTPWPKVSLRVRRLARGLLKHYPSGLDLKLAAKAAPTRWGLPDEKDWP